MVRKEKKPEIVDQISDKLERSQITIVTDYRGLTVAQITDLRNKLRKAGIEYHVVKNTLANFAAERTGKSGISQFLEGPTAIAFGYDDPINAPKILLEYQKIGDEIQLKVKGGLLGDRALTAQDVTTLAKLPPRTELIGKLMGLLQSPIAGLVTVLNGNLQGLVTILNGRIKQMNQGG